MRGGFSGGEKVLFPLADGGWRSFLAFLNVPDRQEVELFFSRSSPRRKEARRNGDW